MQGLVRYLRQYATGIGVLIWVMLTLVVYLFMLFYSIPAVLAYAPGMQVFDLLPFGYDSEYAESLLTTLAAQGRDAYVNIQLVVDFIFPGLLAGAGTLLLLWLLRDDWALMTNRAYLVLIPLLAGAFDYAENILILIMLKAFPQVNSDVVLLASTMTIIKSVSITLLVLTLLWAGGRYLRAGLRANDS